MLDLSGSILILTGPPGAGKSTTAASLASASAGPAVHLHTDDFWHFIRKGLIPPYLEEANAQNEVVIGILAEVASRYAKGGYFVVVDGIVGPWFLPPFRELAEPLHYIVIRPPVDLAVERCRLRGGDTLTDPVPIRAMHRQFSDLGELNSHAIDTSGESREDTLAAVQTALASGRYLLTPK